MASSIPLLLAVTYNEVVRGRGVKRDMEWVVSLKGVCLCVCVCGCGEEGYVCAYVCECGCMWMWGEV